MNDRSQVYSDQVCENTCVDIPKLCVGTLNIFFVYFSINMLYYVIIYMLYVATYFQRAVKILEIKYLHFLIAALTCQIPEVSCSRS